MRLEIVRVTGRLRRTHGAAFIVRLIAAPKMVIACGSSRARGALLFRLGFTTNRRRRSTVGDESNAWPFRRDPK